VDPYDTEIHSFRSKERNLEVNSVRKLFPTVFWDAKGVLVDFLPRGETVEALPYCNAVYRLIGDVQRGLERSTLVSPFSLPQRCDTPHTRRVASMSDAIPCGIPGTFVLLALWSCQSVRGWPVIVG